MKKTTVNEIYWRIDGEGMIGDVKIHGTWLHLWKKKKRENCKIDLIGLLPTNYIIAYITMAYRSLWGNVRCFDVNCKIAQTTQNIWKFIFRKSNLQEMANLSDYPGDFRL